MLLDPVAAYDRLAPEFARISERRRPYLRAIEQLVVDAVPPGAHSMLDVGAGDGSRALKISRTADLEEVTLLEPSTAMRTSWPDSVRSLPIRAEELNAVHSCFDVITCLWNVLGHIFPLAARIGALAQFKRLLSPGGRVMIDLNHRYNARHYGLFRTTGRFIHDLVQPQTSNGDVVASWKVAGSSWMTKGHVFTDREFRRCCSSAGLMIEHCSIVDYATGEIRRNSFDGNLFYVLKARN